jgi:quercetin dioxygenase-like cupin family protein
MYLHNITDINSKEMFPGYTGRFIHTSSMTFAYWDVKAGSAIPEHSHIHEQVAHVLEGKFQLTVDGNLLELVPGQMATIPSNVKHSGIAITDCKLLDVFSPVREDYRIE